MKPELYPRVLPVSLIVILSLPLRADITVTGSGTITVTNSAAIYFNGSVLQIKDSTQVRVQGGGNLTGTTVEIGPLAKLFNCGTVNAEIVNQGEVVSDCGGTSTFLGNVTNNGVFRVSHVSTLVVAGTFQNNAGALLDMITANQTGPPAAFSNAGSLIEAKDLRVASIAAGPADATIKVQGIPPHTYQLFGRPSLITGSWTPIGAAKIASGGLLQFNHPGVVSGFDKYFYKVAVGDQ